MHIPELNKYSLAFPNPNTATPDGIVAWGGDLTPSRVYKAYQNGIFPWYSQNDPIIWWSPNPRFIMELQDFKLSKSLKKNIKHFTYAFDTQFSQVMQNCADVKRKDQVETWINAEMIETYSILHDQGLAHSVECYQGDVLVGGLYGIVVGRVFCGESMFSLVNNASKSAYATLVKHLIFWGYDFIDCQIHTQHLQSLGAKEIPRELFFKKLENAKIKTPVHKWLFLQEL